MFASVGYHVGTGLLVTNKDHRTHSCNNCSSDDLNIVKAGQYQDTRFGGSPEQIAHQITRSSTSNLYIQFIITNYNIGL